METFLLLLALKVCDFLYDIVERSRIASSMFLTRVRCPSGALPRPNNVDQGEPRVPADHPGLRLLRRVPAQVRLSHRVEILHRDLRLLVSLRHHRRQGKPSAPICFARPSRSTVQVLHGSVVPRRSSACTAACPRPSRHWTRSEPLTGSRKSRTMGPCVTSCGRIPKVNDLLVFRTFLTTMLSDVRLILG